jgi:FixJ family two-component response regulator
MNITSASADATVFVVDDDASIRDALSLLISLKGLRASVYSSAEDFLSVYDPTWRGCLLTDLKMPGMSGIDLQALLQQRGVSLPVVVLTAHGDVSTTRAALKNGAVDFLEKPVDDEVLLDVLRNAIRIDEERHRANTENAQAAARLARLTSRERDVLELLAQGLQHRERTLADVVRIGANLRPDGSSNRTH